jgi:hypothetical protein
MGIRRHDRKGTILIVVLGILVLLALLATSFATLQSIERRVTRNYTDEVRAKLVAQSGIEMALDRLNQIINQGWFKDGFKADRTWINFGTLEDESLYYTWLTDPVQRPGLYTKLEKCKNPSFAYETDTPAQDPYDANTFPKKLTIEGNQVGFSGIVGGTYAQNADLYTLKVLDCQSQINVNDGVQYGLNHSVSQNLKRMLNVLGNQINPAVANLGDQILNKRPPLGYQNKYEVLRALNNNQALFDQVRDFITTTSWTNPQVHNPVPLSADPTVLSRYPITYDRPSDPATGPIYRLGHGKSRMGDGGMYNGVPVRGRIDQAAGFANLRWFDPALDVGYPASSSPWHAAIWNSDALNPQWIEVVARSPVNVNTATPEVLTTLFTDLEGFFLLSRRFPNPADIFYGFLSHRYYYDPEFAHNYDFGVGYWARTYSIRYQNVKQCELGHIYRTMVLSGPGSRWGTTTSEPNIGTNKIVQELLACRERKVSPNLAGVNYATEPFGGPFRTWAQFNRFVDSLVERGLIADTRDSTYFYDYNAWAGAPNVLNIYWKADTEVVGRVWQQDPNPTRIDSAVQRRIASQAMADVIKANFNPNLHLNELNPDRNRFLLVDKTDLIVNSTEFCFTPMGYFEVESLGYVLKPTSSSATDSMTAADNQIIAKKKIATVVQLFDAKHVTLQSDLYQGDFGDRKYAAPTTNNNCATESGPEPDNGPQPLECSWDGTVTLSTHGGIWTDPNFKKPKGDLRTTSSIAGFYPGAITTPMGTSRYNEFLYAPFQLDHWANYHQGGPDKCKPLGPSSTAPGQANSKRIKMYRIVSVDGSMDPTTARAQALSQAGADAYFNGATNIKAVEHHPYVWGLYRYNLGDSYAYTIKHANAQFHGSPAGLTYDTPPQLDYTFAGYSPNPWWTDPDVSLAQAVIDCDNHMALHSGWNNPVTRVSTYYSWDVLVEGVDPAQTVKEQAMNFPDVPEGVMGAGISGPYSPPMSTWQVAYPNKYRQCNTFTVGPMIQANDTTIQVPGAPTKYKYGPSDLRLDGAYAEIHSAFGYDIRTTRLDNFGVMAFWYKPNYFPECSTRVRTIVSLANYYQRQTQGGYGLSDMSYPLPFNLFFFPSYHSSDVFKPVYGEPGRPASFLWAVGADRNTLSSGSGGGIGTMTPALNHEFEPRGAASTEDWDRFTGSYDGGRNELRHHEWTHVVLGCAPGSGFSRSNIDKDPWWGTDPGPRMVVQVNGRVLTGTDQMVVHVNDGPNDYSPLHGDSVRIGGEYSETGIKDELGNVISANGTNSAPRMYYADGTVDEFYFWRNADYLAQGTQQFKFGRYYRPNDGNSDDALYTSPQLTLKTLGRNLAPASSVTQPPSTVTETVMPAPVTTRKNRVVAIQWTVLGEDVRSGAETDGTPRLESYLWDYQALAANAAPTQLHISNTADANGYAYPTCAQMWVVVEGSTTKVYGPYHNEWFSVVRDSHLVGSVATTTGQPVELDSADKVRFRAKLRVGADLDTLNSVLLATPVLDDVTLFYDRSMIEYRSYVEVRD